jgi:hypothetical protein
MDLVNDLPEHQSYTGVFGQEINRTYSRPVDTASGIIRRGEDDQGNTGQFRLIFKLVIQQVYLPLISALNIQHNDLIISLAGPT